MVHRHQRDAQRPCGGFGKADTHQHRTDKTGGIGDGHRVNIPFDKTGVLQRLIGQPGNSLYMLA